MTYSALNLLFSGLLVANPSVVSIRSPSLVTSHQSLITRQSSYAYDSANRLLEDDQFSYTYDANGNLIERQVNPCPPSPAPCPSTHYTYDVENQLIRVDLPDGSVAEYRYDALGRRIEKVVLPPSHSATLPLSLRYVYDNEDIIALYDQGGCWKQSILHGPGIDNPLGFIQDTNANCGPFDGAGFREPIRYLTSDGLGSITSLAAETSGFFRALNLKERYTYDSFGNLTITDSSGTVLPESQYGNIYFFTGREYDPETGLYYYNARYYDPKTGRFLQEDPSGLWATDLNLYRYALGNPINRIDPTGLDSYIATQWGHEILVVEDPDNPGGTIAYDFVPKEGAVKSLVAPVPGEVRERKYPPGKKPTGSVEVPLTRKKQTPAQDRQTIERAKHLKRAAESGDLKFRTMISDLNCVGFAVTVQSGAE